MKNKCANCGKVKTKPQNKYCSLKCRNIYVNARRNYSSVSTALKKFFSEKRGEFKVKCHKCSYEISVTEYISKFPQKKKYFCSVKCSHSRNRSDDFKKLMSIKTKTHYASLSDEEKLKRANRITHKIFRSKGEIKIIATSYIKIA